MTVPVLNVERHWECASCDATHVTKRADVHTPMHPCRGLKGLTMPFLPAGTKAKNVAVEREDYVGAEHVQVDGDGRPIMSVITVRDDGQDCTVYAPAAVASAKSRN